MRARIIGLAAAVALAISSLMGHPQVTSAATAEFFVTGYVLRGYTATGTYVHPGTCAVDPRIIPLGTYIWISGIGSCHAEDTGGMIIGYRVDVWVSTVGEAYAITGWHTVTWGAAPTQQVLGYHATPPRAPAPRPVPVPPARPVQHTHKHGWYSHSTTTTAHNPRSYGYVPNPIGQPISSRIGLHGKGCHTTYWTTYVAGHAIVHWATICN